MIKIFYRNAGIRLPTDEAAYPRIMRTSATKLRKRHNLPNLPLFNPLALEMDI